MADAGSYERVTYGAMNSSYARGAAELLTGHVLDDLATLFGPSTGALVPEAERHEGR